jgi:hypothetical protein
METVAKRYTMRQMVPVPRCRRWTVRGAAARLARSAVVLVARLGLGSTSLTHRRKRAFDDIDCA